MKNKLEFKKHLKDSIKIKIESDKKWKEFNVLKKYFDSIFPLYKGNFKAISDWIYYLGGGWPKENSKGRMEEALDKFSTAYIFLTLIDKQNIADNYLNKYGIKVSIESKNLEKIKFDLTKKTISKFQNTWKNIFNDNKTFPSNSIDLIKLLIVKSQELQKDICDLADMIKIDIADEVKDICDLSKRNFLQCVSLGKLNIKEKQKRFQKKKKEVIKERVHELHEAIKNI